MFVIGWFPCLMTPQLGTFTCWLHSQLFCSPSSCSWINRYPSDQNAVFIVHENYVPCQITSVIVNRKEHKLKKGCGYHLDMLVCGIMVGVCSLLGLPWCVAATVLCLGHVDSLKVRSTLPLPALISFCRLTVSLEPLESPQCLWVSGNKESLALVSLSWLASLSSSPPFSSISPCLSCTASSCSWVMSSAQTFMTIFPFPRCQHA